MKFASLASTHRRKVMSWFHLYRMVPLTKKPVANLLNVLLSFLEIPGGYSLFSTYCLISKYHGFPSRSSSIAQ
ncbi:hypothetical protein GmHk_02G004887 [Glycine max]|nr:hypothetical protein GmHk_02G004887 [Glycine max]